MKKQENKLCKLYNGNVPANTYHSRVLIFSVSPPLKNILELEINCHFKTPASMRAKKIETDKLFLSLKRKKEFRIDGEERPLCDLKQIELKPFIDHNKDLLTRDCKALKVFKQSKKSHQKSRQIKYHCYHQ